MALSEGPGVTLSHQQTRLSMLDRLRDAPAYRAYHRQAHCLRFDEHHAETLGIARRGNYAGHTENRRPRHPLRHHGCGLGSQKAATYPQPGSLRFVLRPQRTIANHHQLEPPGRVAAPRPWLQSSSRNLSSPPGAQQRAQAFPVDSRRGWFEPLHVHSNRVNDRALFWIAHLQPSSAYIR